MDEISFGDDGAPRPSTPIPRQAVTALGALAVIGAVVTLGLQHHGHKAVDPAPNPSGVWVARASAPPLPKLGKPLTAHFVVKRAVPPSTANELVVTPSSVWVANLDTNVVTGFDRRTGRPLPSVRIDGPDQSRIWMAYGDGWLWILQSASDRLLRVNATTGAVTATVSLGQNGTGAGLAYGDGAVWVVTGAQQNTTSGCLLLKVDPRVPRLIARASMDQTGSDATVVVGPQGVWVGEGQAGAELFDPSSLEITEMSHFNMGPVVQLAPGRRGVWVLTPLVVTLVTDATQSSVPVDLGLGDYYIPQAIAQDGDGRAWIAGHRLQVVGPSSTLAHPVAGTEGVSAVVADGDSIWVLTLDHLIELDARQRPFTDVR